ncbi:MAG: hypothetical protein ACJAX2_002539 [Celeribacter sp.]
MTYAVGGESEADIANAVLAKDDAAEINFFAEIRRLQILRGQTPNVVVWMNEGHNQRNETIASVGRRAITDPDSPLALLDNFEAIQRHYDALWQAQGWDVQELTYIIVVDHPVSDPDDDKLIAYRAILQSYGPVADLFRSFDLVFCLKGETKWHHHNEPQNSAQKRFA